MTVPQEKAPANSVPAAAVRRKVQALLGITGRKASAGVLPSPALKCGAQLRDVSETRRIESQRGIWNVVCRGKIRRSTMERQKRRQDAGCVLTLRDESVGSEGD